MRTLNLRNILGGIFLSAICIPLFSQKENPRLIIRADDMGSFHSVNIGIIDCYKKGILKSVEVMVVTPWFPEAVKMLHENPGLDVGLHLVITSEWENAKWRPLTYCPSLTDKNGYFYPMMTPNPAYPGQSITENNWDIAEIEKEFRAQIELALKNIPQISHISGHMFSTDFDKNVITLAKHLGQEYNIPIVDCTEAIDHQYVFTSVHYGGPSKTPTEKESSFISQLKKLESGKTYVFCDHPALNNDEMQPIGHIGYEDVGIDRQGVVDLLTSDKVKQAIQEKNVELINYNDLLKPLPRSTPIAEKVDTNAIIRYFEGVKKEGQDIHSLMILRHGKVVSENWLGDNASNKPHILFSISKTFTATAIGFAVSEGRLKVTDKVISFFPDKLPATISNNLKKLEVRHLLTMSSGHDVAPNNVRFIKGSDWVQGFFAAPFEHEPGTFFIYNSMGSYILSAIIQKVTGEKVIDYLYPRLFRPLGITGAFWEESPQGINAGGWGLYLKTEDMAKMGLFILQKGVWNGKQLLPESWIETATSWQIASIPPGQRPENITLETKEVDWLQGYGYQMWRGRYNTFRADGNGGQYIIIIPEKDAIIVTTANVSNMQAEMDLIWKYLLPAFK
ncbi:Carbohydrate deacetylase [termite gut metagenome]|uniref:Carbohydrate deacetylase n=1 Tax=termite gut metagenome TaxID=433724 RepID=A0A5J4SQ48_9ZZZZ